MDKTNTFNSKILFFWVLAGILSLFVFVNYYNQVFPLASIKINLDKTKALKVATDFIERQGYSVEGYDYALRFDSDYNASVYLQKKVGIAGANFYARGEVPIWFWRVRFFKELSKEGFIVDLNPTTGQIITFKHFILEDHPGADIEQKQARALAKDKVQALGANLDNYTLFDYGVKKRQQRTDYYYVWQKNDFSVKEANLRIKAQVQGGRLGGYSKYLKVPETFLRDLDKQVQLKSALKIAVNLLIFILIAFAIISIIYIKQINFDWRMGAYFGGIVILAGILSFLNNLPLLWSFYSTTSSKILFFFNNLGSRLVDIFSGGFLVFALAAIGQSLAAHNKIELPLINLFKKRKATYREFFTPFIVGYASGFIFLGYVTLFYLGAKEAVDIWMPPQTVYSNVLGTFAPFIFPLTLALTAAINEELFFRLFAVSFLRRWLPLFLAILVPAVLWGFAHSHYAIFPAYIRGIELTIFGVFLGFVFIRYGLLSVVVAHFIIDAFLGGLPLLRSGDSYFFISGILVIASAFLPLVVGLFLLQFNE